MELLTLIAGLALPWAFGTALVCALDRRAYSGSAAWRLGCGWFVGMFLLTVWMRALSVGGVAFGIASVAAPIALATAALAAVLARQHAFSREGAARVARTLLGRDLPSRQRIVWVALLAWLAIHFALLLCEVVERPLYPWDAWTQWGTKARVWFAQRSMSPFVASPDWLDAFSPSVYFDAAPHYPATVPLTQTFAALLIGRWDDALVNLPWWIGGVALGLALFGALRSQRFEPLAALVGTWLVMSLPLLEVHVALAGYADLAMASYVTLAALASLRAVGSRRWEDVALALVLVVACFTVKNPGKVWVLLLLPALAVAWNTRWGLRIAGLAFAAVALVVVVLAHTGATILGYQLQGGFGLSWSALADAYLMFGNWNLLGYAVVAVAVLAWRQLFTPAVAPYTVLVLGGMLFLFFGFAFTNAGAWVEDQSTVNRATLHLAPLLVVWLLVTIRAWYESRTPQSAPVAAA
jgi:hypothetical protein